MRQAVLETVALVKEAKRTGAKPRSALDLASDDLPAAGSPAAGSAAASASASAATPASAMIAIDNDSPIARSLSDMLSALCEFCHARCARIIETRAKVRLLNRAHE